MRVRLDPTKRPVRVKARRYSPDQRRFLDKYIDTLRKMDFVVDMPTASWQAAPLLVPKPGKATYRMAVDLRPVNAATVKEAWPMPHLESEVHDFAGSTCFASLDFVSGYWQLPLHPESYAACGIITPKGVVASRRVLPGLANATSFFQSTVEPLFSSLRPFMKAWLDDFSLHAKDEETLLNALEEFFKICHAKNLFLHARKCRLFERELRWCGRIVSKEGYRLDPSRLEGLKGMVAPKTAEELAQFVYCCRWMSTAIPAFSQRIAPLTSLLESAYSQSGRRTNRSVRNITLRSLSWGPVHEKAFSDLQESLRQAVTLSHPDPEKVVCVFTDASELYWSGVVTQTAPNQLSKPFGQQVHEPLAFLGSSFKGSELNWSTFEKEAFAIFKTFEKMDFLFQCQRRTHVFTDHRNLLFVFAPLAMEPVLGRHVVSKVQRWALFISRFAYVIEHIEGKSNICADMLTRWTRNYRSDRSERQMICSMLLTEAEQVVPSPDDFIWPRLDTIRASQKLRSQRPHGLLFDKSNQLWKYNGRIWIPQEDKELQLKLLIVSHSGAMGHRGCDATASVLSEMFWWPTMKQDVAALVQGCLHCIVTRSGDVVPRPLGTALHGSRPNEVVHIDYLYMGPGTNSMHYTLIIRDDLSSYVWLWATTSCTSEAAAEALSSWLSAFGSPEWLVSDQGSHFKNRLIAELTQEMHIRHHFTTAYSPWANGSVERVCREVLRACRALLSEWKLAPRDWPAVTECVTSVLNQSPLRRLGLREREVPNVYRSPLEVFTGQRPIRPLLRALPMTVHRQRTLDELRARQLINTDKMQDALSAMHKEVEGLTSASRKRQVERHNRKTNTCSASFIVGDFVLVRRAMPGAHKLNFTWKGPYRIVAVRSQWVYEIESLLETKKEVVHARRLHLYRSDMDGKQVHPKLLQAAEHYESRYETAEALKGIRDRDGNIEVLVEWSGLPDESDFTWEPIARIFEDLPGMLEDFLHSSGQRGLKQKSLESFYSVASS